ncbi:MULTISPECIES: hypothetical protein [Paraburkholderia]|uniref:Uncharacterized protein n=1 Tax=Paraburkholderia youngii TaxID=2782701 RepID=A0ABX2NQ75_9BURK|nr:hypothetical protein [Paraburkholderia youngii]NVI06611.1 hypothetical protein [Paraburkholderia youngii]
MRTAILPVSRTDTDMAQCTTAQGTDCRALSVFPSPHAICAAFSLVRQASLDIRHTPIVPPDGMRKLRRYALLKRYDLIAARR